MITPRIWLGPVFSMCSRTGSRWFSRSPLRWGSEDLGRVSELFENHQAPAQNVVEKRDYKIPFALMSAYRQQRRDPDVRFKDVAVVKLRSGDGGPGKVSFLRAAGQSVGPPDGGDGGSGGNVYIQAVAGLNSLHHVRHIYKAQNGRGGGSTQLSGKNGDNVILQVPVGTVVRWAPPLDELKALYDAQDDNTKHTGGPGVDLVTPVDYVTNFSRFDYDLAIQLVRDSYTDGGGWIFKEKEEEFYMEQPYFQKIQHKVRYFDLIARRQEREKDTFPSNGIDLSRVGEPIKVLSGGSGGLGNIHFQSGEIRNPRFAKMGRSGLEATFILELRLIADLGLVGLPNAGKSSLLRAISRARPRVGHWEFTTLSPTIGTISTGISEPTFTVADIPGIIAGASENKGLGLGFLRHIERSGGLVFVIGLDSANPGADLETLLREVGPDRLRDKRVLVIATKADLPEAEANYATLASHVAELKDSAGRSFELVPCSAIEAGNVEAVIQKMGQVVRAAEASNAQ